MKRVKILILYPIIDGGLSTIIASTLAFTIAVIITKVGGNLIGAYGAVPGVLLEIAVIGFSLGFLPQIVFHASEGKESPPNWQIKKNRH